MPGPGIFPVGMFATLSRTTRDILHHYDKIGLLSPISRGQNNYRYYSSDQLALANLIRIELDMGMSLAEIKRLNDRRTPERVGEMLSRQIELINAKMGELDAARVMLSSLKKSICSVSDINEQAVTIQFLPEEPIMLGDVNDYSRGGNEYDALRVFYHDINVKYPNMHFCYPVWGVFPEERIRKGDWRFPTRYYFYHPDGEERRPAAHYAVGYARGGYGHTDGLYKRLLDHVAENGFEIHGNAYEEYPLNETCIANDDEYLIRVMITVREAAKG